MSLDGGGVERTILRRVNLRLLLLDGLAAERPAGAETRPLVRRYATMTNSDGRFRKPGFSTRHAG